MATAELLRRRADLHALVDSGVGLDMDETTRIAADLGTIRLELVTRRQRDGQ